ncbi:MAG TPA: GNAT family N-acetyltransferase [Thermoanaerobaculia bacterium]|nr:GNAT family N-acetyltransferase [Thermoanaerobaculia bacterium]
MRTLFLPPTYQDSVESGRLILRDGSSAFIRLSEPGDRDALREFFHQLSPLSKRRRFFSSGDPAETLLERQCDSSNPRSQLTLIVNRIVEGESRIIATGSYVARDETTAEVAFAVDDEFQGKGLGGLLLERLALLAVRNGFVRFWALTRVENQLMLETFRKSGFPLHSKVEDECVEIDFSVAPSEDSVNRSEVRDRVFTTASLLPIFRPKSIAFIGASRDTTSLGGRILDSLTRSGFQGPISAVNPNTDRVGTLTTYPSARAIPQGSDLAIVAIPRDQVLTAVDDCAAVGIRAVVVITAGFAEADEEGRALQEKLLARVRGHGMRMVGPNSMGLLNADPGVRLNASLFRDLPPHGKVAMSSPSGALGLAMLALAEHRQLGVSTFVNTGNKADVSGNDLLQYWQGDDATRIILLYVESFGNPRRFARVARGLSRSKPIVVVKAERSGADPEAARPGLPVFIARHDPVNAFFRQTGVIRAETLDEMFDIAAALDNQPLPAGRRVAILSDGGGPGVLCASACRAARLSVSSFSESTTKRLAAFLSSSTTIGNPLELAFPSPPDAYARAVETLLSAPEVDALIAIHTPLDSNGSDAVLEEIRRGTTAGRAAAGSGKPILACLVARGGGGAPIALPGDNIPTYAFPESAARVLGKVAAYAEWRAGPLGVIPDFDDIDPASAREICRKVIEERGGDWLSVEEARSVLAAMHLMVAAGGLARSAGDAAQLARTIGFPVVVKLASRRSQRLEKGLIHLNLADEAAVERAFEAIRRPVEAGDGPEAMEGVLVQPMVASNVEVMVSMAEDPSYGPLIAFGLGGVHVELIADVGVRVTPLTDRAAAAMVQEIRGYPLLEGYRGHPPADVPAIHDVLLRVSRLVEEVPEIAELVLSPIFVGAPGEGCRIGDSRIRVAPPLKGQAARYTTASPSAARSAPAASTPIEDTIVEGAFHDRNG